jgi:anion-transporting  ArsA/GET3 family ATPase
MAFILTFLGKGGVGKTTCAIASAKQLASDGQRVLLASQDSSPAFGLLLGQSLGSEATLIENNLWALQLQSAKLLEKSWEELKDLERKYMRTPFLKNVYGQELGVLPGMDSALALNLLRQLHGQYDVIVFDGNGGQDSLRMLGTPEVVSWYLRRFRQVFLDSDLGRTLGPFIPPVAAAVMNVNWAADNFSQPTQEIDALLEQGKQSISDPNRAAAFLVTDGQPASHATARYLWGAAQQVGLTVAGVLVRGSGGEGFAPLPGLAIPSTQDWPSLMAAMPDLSLAKTAPQAVSVDVAQRRVSLFLPGFDKTQVKLSQSGPEITIEAGDQRRNLFLPPQMAGLPSTGAKFQDGYLIISF